jgi:two-component system, OmpR family, response regulator MprA
MGAVLIVEDEQHLADGLRFNLEAEGYAVEAVGDGEAALDLLLEKRRRFDAVVLDVMLPGKSGFEVAAELRRAGQFVPVLMLTARGRPEDVLRGFESGADDYLPKPFERSELLARIRALLRRRPPRGSASIVVGDLLVNPDTREVKRGEREIELTNREFELLEYLARNAKLVVSRERLLEDVWGYDPFEQTNTIDVFISNLRRKLESGGEPRLLHTKRGAGYVLKAAA